MAILEYCGLIDHGKVVGVDIDIREHNLNAIKAHPLGKKINLLEGSSIDPQIVQSVGDISKMSNKVLVILDSNHTHQHVLEELRAYGPMVTEGSYCIVNDTGIEELDTAIVEGKAWGRGNSPMTAVKAYLEEDSKYHIDHYYELKALVTSARNGFLLKRRCN